METRGNCVHSHVMSHGRTLGVADMAGFALRSVVSNPKHVWTGLLVHFLPHVSTKSTEFAWAPSHVDRSIFHLVLAIITIITGYYRSDRPFLADRRYERTRNDECCPVWVQSLLRSLRTGSQRHFSPKWTRATDRTILGVKNTRSNVDYLYEKQFSIWSYTCRYWHNTTLWCSQTYELELYKSDCSQAIVTFMSVQDLFFSVKAIPLKRIPRY